MSEYNLQKTIPALERSLAFFRPHHLELRNRLIKIFASIVICTVVAYLFVEKIAGFCIAPLMAASPLVGKLVYTNLPEAFISYIKLALMVGLLTSFPVALYQIWVFIAPGLHKSEKKLAVIIVFWASLLFIGGGAFAFFAVLPKMLVYFMSYAHEGLEPLPKLGMYLTFVARTVMTFGLSFQIPFLMVMAGKAGVVRSAYFRSKRVYFYMAILGLSFLLTAGDFMATALLAFPLFGLYEIGIFLSAIFSRKNKSKAKS
ncbi:twin-arginine translocase subunit TatC [Desulfopila aestuarii]|uniref:Sec-independent protein translocase protein TatC n=1 Tax=Desulfopila aestuarii DSM 18488 TaxID=1121416 RepID=A0A1M7Y1L5_9BACT|nr:twin-arginine translocase subunit TatC [Desulfopila aestuarii]SHO45649.1 sec-independent protein translocase protein TatC [Desulfopila aestuarii DSM 18488]